MNKVKLMLAALLLSGLALPAAADNSNTPSAKKLTVADVKDLPDDTEVILEGYIASSLGDEEYIFKDETGSIKVEIDDDEMQTVKATPNDRVEIRGEIDTHMMAPADIEVESIRLVQ